MGRKARSNYSRSIEGRPQGNAKGESALIDCNQDVCRFDDGVCLFPLDEF
jgi:hypothetical protein